MQAHHLSDTIVALSTGQGTAAISVIRLSGPQAVTLTDQVFKGVILEKQSSHTLHYGRIINENGDHLDDVVIGLYRAPKSYTSEDVVEISCHGSPYIVREILALLIRQGARPADAGEFTMRAFLHGRMDLSQAEAVADLIASQTSASHRMAVQQMRGGISSEIQHLRQKLLDFASLIELELDFSEEDVEFANRDALRKLVEEVIEMIVSLKKTFHLGNAIKEGIPTVIAGRPNAGKSTLLNKLLKEERAIVSDIPGTTRDTIEEVLVIEGIQYRLIDTAGIREAHDEIEQIGIQRTMEKIEKASILIYVFDVTEVSPSDVLRDLGAIQPKDAHVILVANKMDLSPRVHPEDWKIGDFPIIPMAAVKNMNVPYLLEVLGQSVTRDIPTDMPVISSARHYHALTRAEERLRVVWSGLRATDGGGEMPDAGLGDAGLGDAGLGDAGSGDAGLEDAGLGDAGLEDAGLGDAGLGDAGLGDAGSGDAGLGDAGLGDAGLGDAGSGDARPEDARLGGIDDPLTTDASTPLRTSNSPLTTHHSPLTTDLLAQDIRQAMYHLGEITGEISTEDLLGNIFGRFCIGK